MFAPEALASYAQTLASVVEGVELHVGTDAPFEDTLGQGPAPTHVIAFVHAPDVEPLEEGAVERGFSAPMRGLVDLARATCDRWMEDGTAGAWVVVLVPPERREPTMLEAGVRAFVRSLAKEQARRGVRPSAWVGRDARALADAIVWSLAPESAPVVGETLHVGDGA